MAGTPKPKPRSKSKPPDKPRAAAPRKAARLAPSPPPDSRVATPNSRVIREERTHVPAVTDARPRKPSSDKASEQRGKYVYCVIRSAEPLTFGPIGFGAEPAEVH